MPQSGTLPDLTGSVVDDGRLQLDRMIGAGAYGKLYKALDTTSPSSSSTFYAVKCLRRPNLSSHDAKFQDRERALHYRVSCHPNVVTLRRHFTDAEHVFMVMDLCVGGDMYCAILDGVYRRNALLIQRVLSDLTDAVRFCHSRGVYHRDLKPENILVNYDGGNPRIADFGLSSDSRVSREVDCGSGPYMCPESFGSASSSYCPGHSDVWALCIILINLVTTMNPWATAQYKDWRWNSFITDPGFLREILPISSPLSELLICCFRINPGHRPTITQLRHEVLSMSELFMSDADLEKASPGVRRAAGCAAAAALVYDPSDWSGTSSSSGSGYSSLDAHLGRPVNFPAAAGLVLPAPVAGGSRLTVPTPASIPSAGKVPFASRRDLSSAVESDGPLTPPAHLVHLPPMSPHQQQDGVLLPKTPSGGKFKRFIRRLRVWRKL
ncbi:kinase-like domain-containing protein [Mycena capillaripes]|nr:kinase-like domain-containing protein [Mycena capillaripes]